MILLVALDKLQYGFFLLLTRTMNQNIEQEHEMCKTNVKMDIYCVNICKHEHEKNMTRLWCKIVFKTIVEHTKRNEGSYSYLSPFGDLVQGSFQENFYVCIK
jgi:hypothetical protein